MLMKCSHSAAQADPRDDLHDSAYTVRMRVSPPLRYGGSSTAESVVSKTANGHFANRVVSAGFINASSFIYLNIVTIRPGASVARSYFIAAFFFYRFSS